MNSEGVMKMDLELLMKDLEKRFKAHMHRHEGIQWESIESKLKSHSKIGRAHV